MRVVCTDRGRHAERRLNTVVREADGLVTLHHKADRPFLDGAGLPPMPFPEEARGLNKHSWRFRCPSCGRDVLINEGRFEKIFDEAERVALQQLDVSYLE